MQWNVKILYSRPDRLSEQTFLLIFIYIYVYFGRILISFKIFHQKFEIIYLIKLEELIIFRLKLLHNSGNIDSKQ